MRIPRIHHPERLIVGSQIALSDDAANHVGRVLRMTAGQHLQLFDGSNRVFDAVITEAGKKNVTVEVLSGEPDDRESPLHIHLGRDVPRRKNGIHHPEIDRTRGKPHNATVFRALRR